jgi:hypothetical protein
VVTFSPLTRGVTHTHTHTHINAIPGVHTFPLSRWMNACISLYTPRFEPRTTNRSERPSPYTS